VGSDCIRSTIETQHAGPPGVLRGPAVRPMSHMPPWAGPQMTSFYTGICCARFGDDWKPKWIDFSLQRWRRGFQTVANGRTRLLWAAKRTPYPCPRRLGMEMYMGMPTSTRPNGRKSVPSAPRANARRARTILAAGLFIANERPAGRDRWWRT